MKTGRLESQLLDRTVPEDYLNLCTERIAAKTERLEVRTKSVLIFRLAAEWLALPTEVFQEVAEGGKLHRVPHRRDPVLIGLVHVRGDLLLCVALEALLGIEGESRQTQSGVGLGRERLLVCNHRGNRFAFLANEVHGVYRYDPADLRSAPATVAKGAAGIYVRGIIPWKDRTVGCLDEQIVFYALNKGLS